MDFDSSSKFISSLAKFLQSLCNGYVEFNSGVEVIGHIYLSVDTGKKIDYILNEKVCKTDENSVTFISNSFHAQPAEKPKPPVKSPTADLIKPPDTSSKASDEDIIIMDEPESKNVGTIPSRNSFQHQNSSSHSRINRPSKRSFNQSFPSSHRHSMKHSRPDPSTSSNGSQLDTDSLHSEHNSSSNFLPPQLVNDATIMAATESDLTHLSKVFPQTFSDSVNSEGATEERDVKPQLDSELKVIQVKQEYEQSIQSVDDEPEIFDDSQDQSTAFPGMSYDQYYAEDSKRGPRSDYGHLSGMVQGEFFSHGAGPSSEGVPGDSAGTEMTQNSGYWQPQDPCPVKGCLGKQFYSRMKFYCHWKEKHEKIVMKYLCPYCNRGQKRKRDVSRHALMYHGRSVDLKALRGTNQPNQQYMNPGALTLEHILGHHVKVFRKQE